MALKRGFPNSPEPSIQRQHMLCLLCLPSRTGAHTAGRRVFCTFPDPPLPGSEKDASGQRGNEAKGRGRLRAAVLWTAGDPRTLHRAIGRAPPRGSPSGHGKQLPGGDDAPGCSRASFFIERESLGSYCGPSLHTSLAERLLWIEGSREELQKSFS